MKVTEPLSESTKCTDMQKAASYQGSFSHRVPVFNTIKCKKININKNIFVFLTQLHAYSVQMKMLPISNIKPH